MRKLSLQLVYLASAIATLFSTTPLLASDTILIHGHVYTGSPKMKWAEALALTGGTIDAVGTDQEISKRRDSKTKVIDLQGRTVIPGISDAHTHTWFGGLALRGFNLSTQDVRITPDEPELFVARIKEFASNHPTEKVLFGRAQFSSNPNSSAKHELLDRAVPDRPLVIHGTGEHSLFVNAKALEMAGITDKPVADPVEEKYVIRDAQGHPTGVLLDPAMQLIVRALPVEPLEERMAVLRNAAHYLNSFGITSVNNATGNLREIETYAALRDRGELTIRTRTAFAEVSVNHHLTPQFLADLDKARTTYHDDWVSANLVKFFADGAGPTTARFESGFSGPHSPTWYEPEDYRKIIMELDKRGYQIMTHAIGNAASHMVLDAYEQLEEMNGPKDRRLRMEHAGAIIPDDISRFAKLSVIPDLQPAFCCGPDNSQQKANQWQSLIKAGAEMAFSSDWPCSWPPDPYLGVQQAVMREVRRPNASGTPEYSLPDERLTVEQAITAYTKTSTYARFSDKQLGTLEDGKDADLVVLSQDIFTAQPAQIGKTRALMTMVGGKIVFQRNE
ncbi:MAG: amidohydrolase [Bryobacteraceae bacterium]|jgi:predicted amidohydrolase YtcJ